jgi:hypothetical protein
LTQRLRAFAVALAELLQLRLLSVSQIQPVQHHPAHPSAVTAMTLPECALSLAFLLLAGLSVCRLRQGKGNRQSYRHQGCCRQKIRFAYSFHIYLFSFVDLNYRIEGCKSPPIE